MKTFLFAPLLAVLVLLASCRRDEGKVQSEKLPVVVEQVKANADYAAQRYVGQVEAERSALVSFTGTGMIVEMAVSEGQHVKKGQLIARLDESQARHMVEEATLGEKQAASQEAQSATLEEQAANKRVASGYTTAQASHALALAKATLDQAADALARMQTLHEKGSLPDVKWVEVQTKYEQAQQSYNAAQRVVDEARVEALQSDLGLRQARETRQASRVGSAQSGVTRAIADKNLRDCAIYAPTDGVVVERFLSVGEVALPSQPVVRMMTTKNVSVVVSVPEADIQNIEDGMRCVVRSKAIAGEEWVSRRLTKVVDGDATTHTYKVKIEVEDAGHRLLPGMVCEVLLAPSEAPLRLTVPLRAVGERSDGSHFVWVFQGGKAHRRTIEIGELRGNRALVVGGLREGETIITEGYQKVDEGSEVITTNSH